MALRGPRERAAIGSWFVPSTHDGLGVGFPSALGSSVIHAILSAVLGIVYNFAKAIYGRRGAGRAVDRRPGRAGSS